MKKKATIGRFLILAAGIVASLVLSCAASQAEPGFDQPAMLAIESYREIPGITDAELDAIEAFKKAGRRFSYASLATTETYRQPHGAYSGFTVKFSELLSNLFGIPFDLHVLEWDKLINNINNKYYDFTCELTPTPERAQQYCMTYPIVERALVVFSLAGSARIERETDLDGKRVGFLADAITAQTITESYPSLNFIHVDVSSTQDAIEKLQAGVIDAFVNEAPSSVVFADSRFSRSKELFSMVYTPISLATANPELKPIISAIDKFILSGGFNKIHELYISENNEYNKHAFNASLTTEEAGYLRNLFGTGAKVPVALETQLYPISFYNKQDGEYQGIVKDILHEINNLTGIVFDVVSDESSPWSQIFEMLQTGEVALVSELLYTKERRGRFLFSDHPYATCHYALLSKLDYPNLERYQVPFANVGVVTGTAPASVFEDYFPNHKNVKYYQYHADARNALESGEVDLLMASEYQLLDFIHYRENPGYKINRQMSVPIYESYFGFNVNETLLHSIFNKAIKQIDIDLIEKKWISRSFDYQKIIAAAREQEANQRFVIASWFATALFVAFIILLAFIIRDIHKRKIIENQTVVINALYNTFPDLVFTKDLNSQYTSANRSALLFAGTTIEDLLGKTTTEIFPDDTAMAETFSVADEIVLQENKLVRTEIVHEGSDGLRKFFEIIKTPLVSKGKSVGLLGFIRDITEHKELLEKIKYQSQYELVKYSLTSRAMNIVHYDMEITAGVPVGSESKVVWSEELRHMFGFDNENDFPNVLGSVSNRLYPEDKDKVLDAFFTHYNDRTGKTACDFECRAIVHDGTYKYFRVAIGTMRDEEGIPIRIAGAIEDINEKKRIQQELDEANRINAESLHTLESILNGLGGMLYVSVPDTGELLFINDHMKKHFNLDDDCVGQRCYSVFQANKNERCEFCPCYQLDKEPDKTVVWEEKNNLTNRSYNNTDRYILWPDGRTVHLQYSVDMTEFIAAKEMAEEQRLFIIEEHKRLQTVLDMLPVGVIILRTSDEALLYSNKAIVRIFKDEFEEQSAGQISNKFLPEFQPDGRKSIDVFNEFVQQATPIAEIQCLKVDGEPFIARFTTCRINYQGELCSLGIVEDVTAEKDYQQKLQDIAQKEYEANQAKSKFLAKMSHEIRTPMNAILGMSELALRENMPDAAYEHLFTVKQAGIHLLTIINDVLDFSKIETGKMEVVPAEYSLSSLVNDVISIIRVRLFDTQIRFVVNVDSRIPNSLIGDVTRVRQVLINIMGNAVKYTDKGFVAFAVHGDFTDDDTVMLSMEVKDSGRGIKKEDLGDLFNEYMQIETEKNRGIEGIGLGLAISLSLVKAMDGHITVDSEYGHGSTFTVILPQKINKPDKFALVERKEDKRVLLYERRKVYSDSIGKSLADLDVPYVPITNESELCEEMATGAYPFIFVARALFNTNKECILQAAGHSRIVLLAEFGEAISEGNWSVLGLPAHALSIANVLNGVAEDYLYSANAKSITQFSAPNARILVVDDISTNLKVVEGLLKPSGMTIDFCKSGVEAIAAVKKNEYDLVFMDHRMPGMDGVEATAHIRALSVEDSRYAALPIIALTANAVSGMKDVFLESGFDDYLSKPIDTGKLYNILEKWIRVKHEKRKAETVQGSGEELNAGIHIDGVDTAMGLLHLGGQMALYIETLAAFCDDGDERTEAIRACLDAGNLKTYTIHVHALKSAAANIGAGTLSDAAKDLEMAGVHEDTSYIEAHNEKFLDMLGKVLCDIKRALPSQKEGNQIDMNAFTEELIKLKHALEKMDARSIKSIMDTLKESAPEKHAELVKRIARNILMSEYDEAIECIEATLHKI